MLSSVFLYLYMHGFNIPWQDDWIVLDVLTGERPMTLGWLWEEHNEHRIPLVKFLLVFLYKLTGDIRSLMYLTVAALGGLAFAMIRAARNLRGWTSYTDAFFPLILLHWGHSEVFLWSFEIQYTLSIVLSSIFLIIIVQQRDCLSPGAAILAGTCLVLLPLTGANGLVHVPALALWLIYAGVIAGSSPGPRARLNAAVILSFALASLLVTAAYFIGFKKHPAAEHPYNIKATIVAASQFLTGGFGPAAAWIWPCSGPATAGLFLLGVGALVTRAYRGTPAARSRAVGLLLFIGSMACLTLAMALGRGFVGFFPPYIIMRYYILAALAPCCLYLASTSGNPSPLDSLMQLVLFASISLMAPFNMQAGLDWARIHKRPLDGASRELQAGSTPTLLAEHYGFFLYPWESDEWVATRLQRLHDAGIGPFRLLLDDPGALREVPLSVEPADASRMTCKEGAGRFFLLGDDPYLEFTLEEPQFVYAIKIGCSYGYEANVPISFGMSWEKAGGGVSAARGGSTRLEFGHPFLSPGTAKVDLRQKTITVLIKDTIDRFRIHPDNKPCFFKLSEMSLLFK
jgi:hypothetical protein